jgi:hypothetical protein
MKKRHAEFQDSHRMHQKESHTSSALSRLPKNKLIRTKHAGLKVSVRPEVQEAPTGP